MVIDRNKHNKYSTNQIYGTQSQQQQTEQAGSGSNSGTTIIYQGGGSGLTEEQKKKLDSIEEGAQVNQNAFSKVTISDGSITNEITANDPSDNVTFQGVNPIKLSLIDGVIQISYDGVSLWQVDEDGNLWTDRNVYSTKEISAYGYGDGEQPTGAQYLYELKDVDSSSATKPIDQGILQYDSATGKWVVTDGSNIKPDLTGYATQSWVTEQLNLLVGSAPDVLDTIYEIAEALNNDPDYVKDIANNLSNLTNRVVKLEDMFEWDGDKIKAKADLYSVGEVSAYGYGSGEVPTGAQYLHELKDVTLTEITAGQLLQWDGLKWVNINKDEVGLNESELNQFLIDNNYAKISDITWDNILNKPDSFTTSISDITDLDYNWYTILNTTPKDYVTRWPQFSEITNKPNTLEGYGITDGVNSITLTGSGNAVTTASINGHVITLTKGSTFALSTHNHDSVYVNVTGDTMTGTLTLPTIVVNTRIQLGNAYIEYDSTNNAVVIKNKTTDQIVNFYATGEVSAYGYGDGTSPSGVTYLYELKDVDLTSISEDDMLKWNGEKWVNIPMSSIAGASSWDEITDKPSWIGDTKPSYTFAEITSKPTTLSGYGITDAVTLNTEQAITGNKNFKGNLTKDGKDVILYEGTIGANNKYGAYLGYSFATTEHGGATYGGLISAGTSSYCFQLQGSNYGDHLYFRGKYEDSISSWKEVLLSSNYSTTLDTRYVKKAGDTMTGSLNTKDLWTGTDIKGVYIEGLSSLGVRLQYLRSTGTYDQIWLKDGSLLFNNNTVWHAGNDGKNSGLDADLLDGYQGGRNGNYVMNILNYQMSDHVVCVVGFIDLTNPSSDPSKQSLAIGNIGIFRSNAVSGINVDIQFQIQRLYNSTIMIGNWFKMGSAAIARPVTFTYNGVKYGGFEMYLNSANGALKCMLRHGDIEPIIVAYKNNSTGNILNQEIANSIKEVTTLNNTLTANASTATKLQTARTIWGQSFDGTNNITGALTDVSSITFTKASQSNYLYLSSNGINFVASPYYYGNSINAVGQDGSTALATVCGVYGHADVIENIWYGGTGFSDAVITIKPATGNVGIGTTSPSSKLDINGESKSRLMYFRALNGSNAAYIGCGATTTDNVYLIAYEANNIYLGTNNSVGACIVSNNFGIGTTSPSYKLHVAGTMGVTGAVTMSSTLNVSGNISLSGNIVLRTSGGAWINGKTSAPIMANGDSSTNGESYHPIIWGRTTAGNVWNLAHGALDQVGFFGYYSSTTDNRTDWQTYIKISTGDLYHSKSLTVAGNIVAYGEVTAYSSSDIRLKTNIKELKAINTLRKINTFEYDWTEEALSLKTNKNKHDYGIIAQELIEIIPEAVTTNMYDKGYYGINYVKLIPFTISAIKEVDDEVTTLKNRVKELEERLSKYESNIK